MARPHSQFWAFGLTYKVFDVSVRGLKADGLTGISGGFEVGSETLSTYQCGSTTEFLDNAFRYPTRPNGAVDLNPPRALSSDAFGINGGIMVGDAQFGTECNSRPHAGIWNLSSKVFIDLQPVPPISGTERGTVALATDGVTQVGYGYDYASVPHAFAWSGKAASILRLHGPPAIATGVSGKYIVGVTAAGKAILWSGTQGYYGSLPCPGCGSYAATGIDGIRAVGDGAVMGAVHALFWPHLDGVPIDLNSASTASSSALAIRLTTEVGYATPNGVSVPHAAVWNGSAQSYLDLHAFLPAGYTQSAADAVDARGDVAGVAVDSSGVLHAIVWLIVP